MSEVKAQRGRQARWGKNDSDKAKIANDLRQLGGISHYYIQKLQAMGLVEIVLTEKGQQMLEQKTA